MEKDAQTQRDIDNAIDLAKAHLNTEKALNYASLINQMMHFMNQEPNKVMDSNIFITAVDNRNFINTGNLKKSRNYKSALNLMETPDKKAWCDFKYIPELENAPRARDYRTSDGRCIGYLIDLLKAACVNGKVDFDKLKRYSDGTEIPIELRATSIHIVNFIRRLREEGLPNENIVSIITSNTDSISREQILEIINQVSSDLQVQPN